MSTPYHKLPSYTRWSKAVAGLSYQDVDPVVSFPFKIAPTDKVATAGSCFAQHIARHLREKGFAYFVTEIGHPLGTAEDRAMFNYGTFSARYGNIYTARQLLQTALRAVGSFVPSEEIWSLPTGRFVDPFRPAIQPEGFASKEELLEDREQHLSAIRRMLRELDVFVFTLGLTEAWRSRDDGALFPVCPGVNGGEFSPEKYEFVNLNIYENIADLQQFVDLLNTMNPSARIVLTVSPVPLIATAENRHALVSTTYSKSVLRTASEEVTRRYDHVAYFPSYEIITGIHARGRYFAEDLRSVTDEGVEHVMRLFLRHATTGLDVERLAGPATKCSDSEAFVERMKEVTKVICEEELVEARLR